ncbi:hypothetical protein K0M31_009445 [Melipona bicolor]|uniref:Uncharacterized protein n=1 Tax=Melipona bicolor TaxID=60889 RepID=A0AA40FNQ4_9HYME|nr:hypothetical protein K0M31_009445 [Melipona bicolor]
MREQIDERNTGGTARTRDGLDEPSCCAGVAFVPRIRAQRTWERRMRSALDIKVKGKETKLEEKLGKQREDLIEDPARSRDVSRPCSALECPSSLCKSDKSAWPRD